MICYHSTKKFSTFYGDALLICEIDDNSVTNIYLSELDKIKRMNTYEVYKDRDMKCMNVLLRNDKSFEVIVFDVSIVKILDIQYKVKR